jgi:lactate dehydrogenase-like 2-hydroxyacid dehydrogenase
MSDRPEILVVAPYSDEDMEALEEHFELRRLWLAADREGFLAKDCAQVRGIATRGDVGAPRDLIDRLPSLEIISCYGVGLDAIDLTRAGERGVAVTNTPDVLTDDVADMGMALILASLRRIVAGDTYVRTGAWNDGSMTLTRGLAGKTLGIVGYGRVGRALAKRAEAFGMKIAYHDLRALEGSPHLFISTPVELASISDILAITVAGGSSTKAMIGAEVLDALGPQGWLINISRGSAVDEEAAIAALSEGRIAGAGLDVFLNEPGIDRRFLDLPNVVLQPHHSSGTVETRRAMGRLVLANLEAHFDGRPLPSPVK